MRHIGWGIAAGLGAAGLLALAPPAHAQSTPATSGSSASGQSTGTGSSHQIAGTVQKYDKDAKTVTLSNSDKTLKLTDKTRVTKDSQPASASDLREGDEVRASYSGTGNEVDAVTIDIAKRTPGGK